MRLRSSPSVLSLIYKPQPRTFLHLQATMAASNSALTTPPSDPEYKPRYIDVSRSFTFLKALLTQLQIGINLADPIFRGRYHGKSRHPDDLNGVIKRAREVGCTKLLVTGSSFKSSRDALKLAQEFRRFSVCRSLHRDTGAHIRK